MPKLKTLKSFSSETDFVGLVTLFACETSDQSKNLLHSELAEGTRKVGRPFLSFKDTTKGILKRSGVLDIWKGVAKDRQELSQSAIRVQR